MVYFNAMGGVVNKLTIIFIAILLLSLSLNAIANVDISGTVYVSKIDGIKWIGETKGIIKTEELEKLLASLNLPPTVKEYNEYPTKTPDTQKPFKVVEELDWRDLLPLIEKYKNPESHDYEVFPGHK